MGIGSRFKTLYASKTGKIKIRLGVIFLALCFIALISCVICFTTGKSCPIPKTKLVPADGPAIQKEGAYRAYRDEPIPYQMSLRLHNLSSILSSITCRWDHICSAIIIDENTAVTAARCFKETKNASRYRVYAGENRLDIPKEDNEQVLQVRKIIIHPNFTHWVDPSKAVHGNDIAVLHVDRILLNKYVQPALLSPIPTEQLSNVRAITSGWFLNGVPSYEDPLPFTLKEVGVKIESPALCLFRFTERWEIPVQNGVLCVSNPDAHICSDNVGGPLVLQNFTVGGSTGDLLVGIGSNAAIGACFLGPNWKGIFTKINHFYSWIQENRDPPFLPSCGVAMEILSSPRVSKQTIYPHGYEKSTSLEVLCDFEVDVGGWTVIQKRSSGPKAEFSQTWTEYEKGFGSLDGNFWIGLENIHALTKNGDQELRIELEDFEGEKRWAKYSSFSVSDASDFYRLEISGFSGDAEDSMTHPASIYMLNGMRFSTKDEDNDNNSSGSCSVEYFGGGGWWFNYCSASGLNGLYFQKGETVPHYSGILWQSWKGRSYSLAKSEMKIRTRK